MDGMKKFVVVLMLHYHIIKATKKTQFSPQEMVAVRPMCICLAFRFMRRVCETLCCGACSFDLPRVWNMARVLEIVTFPFRFALACAVLVGGWVIYMPVVVPCTALEWGGCPIPERLKQRCKYVCDIHMKLFLRAYGVDFSSPAVKQCTYPSTVGDEVDCSICLESLMNVGCVRMKACEHAFHEECIELWLDVNNVCPNCKARIS